MKFRIITILITSLAIMTAPAHAVKNIKVDKLPEVIVKNIKKVFPDFTIEKATVKDKRGKITYLLKGEYEADGGDYELEIVIDAKGKILKVSEEFEDDKNKKED